MSGSVRIIKGDSRDPIVVTAQGMVSSLGLDAATSCAAARAGIRRAQELDNLKFASLDGREIQCAIGHQAPIITYGFEGASRLAQLVTGALRDLSTHGPIPSGRKGLYLSMPSARRHLTGAELIPDPEVKKSFLEQVDEQSGAFDDHDSTDKVVSLALRQAAVLKDIPLRFVTYAGHTGFAEALAAAVEELQRSDIDLALVGGVDSLVDERSLKWLRLTGRLKGEANPTGLEPGEGAVFLAVERKQSAQRRQAPVLSRIDSIAIADEDRPRLLGRQPTGRALSVCIRSAVDTAANLWLVSDHNGETSRGMEFGNVLARVVNPKTELCPALFPSASFGDTGAASGGLAVCLAQNAFHRNYAPISTAVVASMADGAPRAAFSVTRQER